MELLAQVEALMDKPFGGPGAMPPRKIFGPVLYIETDFGD